MAYDHKKIETKWQAHWEDNKVFSVISDLENFFRSQNSAMILSQLNTKGVFSCMVTNPR